MNGKRAGVAAVAGVVATLLVLTAAGLFVVLSGSYDVAATKGHTAFGQWTLDTTMRNSVRKRASALAPPQRITAEMLAAGAGEYKAMCQQCHAGPGVEREEWATGMLPLPPHLTEAAQDWRTREIYWIAKHGIKISGMPAFGPTHDDATLWNIAAFVSRLPEMSADQYTAVPSENDEAGAEHSHEGHSHEHHSH